MFDNLVRSASMPMVKELLQGAQRGVERAFRETQSKMKNDSSMDDAILKLKNEIYLDLIGAVQGMIEEIESHEQQVHHRR